LDRFATVASVEATSDYKQRSLVGLASVPATDVHKITEIGR
jgi:hypothetical protein